MKNMYDAIIVGGGPAGLSAAIYLARAKYKVLVLEKEKIGGQITITSDVVNYPGVAKISGKELTDKMHQQALAFGAEFALAEVLDLDLSQDIKTLQTTKGQYKALSVILATGANPRKVGFYGEKEFQGRGVAYCATCDGEFFTGMDVFVIGGGFAAVEESIFLTKYAKNVTILVRKDHFSCAKTVVDELSRYPKISVKYNTEIVKAGGEQMLSFAEFKNNKTNEVFKYEAKDGESFGIFVFAGYVPNTKLFADKVTLNEQGYVITDNNQKTNIDGVYAAGDLCIKNLRQVVTAVSDGAIAATSSEKHISLMHDKLNLPEFSRAEVDTSRLNQRKEAITHQEENNEDETSFISTEIREKLLPIFAKFEQKVIVKAWLDDSELSSELKSFIGELDSLTDKISCLEESANGKPAGLELLHQDGSSSGIFFHAVPGGHEFNSFIIALYNVAGPGQAIDDSVKEILAQIDKPIDIKVMVSLSCTMCPEVVMGSQKLASESKFITAQMFDIQHFPEIKQKYKIMSVPCMVINDKDIYFGKKNIVDIANLLK